MRSRKAQVLVKPSAKFTKKVAPKSHFTIKVVPKSQFYEMEKSIMNKNYN